jgi:hypothetical protein
MTHLHRALQEFYAGPDGELEATVDGFRVDVLRGGTVHEIQTGRFRAIHAKLAALAQQRPVVLVHPIAARKTLVKIEPASGEVLSERLSPKRGRLLDAFLELPSLTDLLGQPNLALEVVLTVERELRGPGPGSRRRRGVEVLDRRLTAIEQRLRIDGPADLPRLLPVELPAEFTAPQLMGLLSVNLFLARKITYTLARTGVVRALGRRGRGAVVYAAEMAGG